MPPARQSLRERLHLSELRPLLGKLPRQPEQGTMSRDLSPKEARDRFLTRRRQRQADETVRSYAHRLTHFVEWCEENDIELMSDLGGWEIDEYRHYRESGDVAPSTVKSAMVSIKQLLEFCERIDVVDEDVAKKVEIPKLTKDEETSDEQLPADRAREHLAYFRESDKWFGTAWHAYLEVTWHTACRLGGLRGLDLGDYDADEATLRFHHRPDTETPLKNDTEGERIVSINDDVVEALDMYITRERPDKRDMYGRDSLFATRQGRPSRTTIRSWSYQATQPCLYTGCPHSRERHSCEWTTRGSAGKCPSSRSPHAVRTGAITWLLNVTDGDIEYVARRVNAKPATIRRYYDQATVVEEFEERQQRHLNLDINNESA